jgi:hypothetical protein
MRSNLPSELPVDDRTREMEYYNELPPTVEDGGGN